MTQQQLLPLKFFPGSLEHHVQQTHSPRVSKVEEILDHTVKEPFAFSVLGSANAIACLSPGSHRATLAGVVLASDAEHANAGY